MSITRKVLQQQRHETDRHTDQHDSALAKLGAVQPMLLSVRWAVL